ncbi:MAG TPA: HAMP domain-containing sensor histidine kinase [Candidatus Dormibacteraeota bacterium]|nr:HAMP domain-containing sensor histidine kinase [Candidatus Dormibacteraeota bacterium]
MIDKRRTLRRFEPLFTFAADYYLLISSFFFVVILADGARRGDARMRAEVNLAVYKATADIGHLFRNYTATQSFSDKEILELSKRELRDAVQSWTSTIPSRVTLQVIALRENTLFDSYHDQLLPYRPLPSAKWPLLNLFRADTPVRFADQDVTEHWKFRTAITRDSYITTMIWHLVKTSLPVGAGVFILGLFPHFYREGLMARRHFEALIRIVLTNPSELKDEEELIIHLPAFVREVMDFDSVAVYWLSAGRIVLRAVDSAGGYDPSSLRKALGSELMALDTHGFEAQVAAENRPLVARRRGWRRAVHLPEREGDAMYMIAPVYDPKKRQVIGVLTAERLRDLEPGDREALPNIARLVMILVETARSTVEMEKNYEGLIALTRQVALGTVVPVVAHNLRTPLTMISMMARDLGEKWAQMEPVKVKRDLAQIDAQTAQSLAILNTITAYNRIGGASVSSDLYDVLEKTCAFFHEYLRLKRIHLARNFQPNYRPQVNLRPVDLQQVVTNLLINADQAIEERGRTSSVNRIDITVAATEDRLGVVIRVRDNGPGIPVSNRALIFEEDFTTKPYGTGAGLAYCKRVIVRAGGRLELEPISGPGATFKISLPTKVEGRE